MDFDSTIPPGGEGKITLKLDLRGYQGEVKKTATVFSNDPQNGKLVLAMQGRVKSLIEIRPSSSITFRGLADQQQDNVLEIQAIPPHSFRIEKTESNLEGKIAFEVQPIQEGTHYKLKVSNQTKQGNYSGFIKIYTDSPQKPNLVVRVAGYIEGDISVKPQTLVVGKLAAQQPMRVGKVMVTSNRGKPFKVTRLTYNDRYISVTQQPMPNGEGYSLEVVANAEQVSAGSRQQTVLTIETDASPDDKHEVQVHVLHAAEGRAPASARPGTASDADSKHSLPPSPAETPPGEQLSPAGRGQ